MDPHPEGVLMKADPLHHSICSSHVVFGVQKQGREMGHTFCSLRSFIVRQHLESEVTSKVRPRPALILNYLKTKQNDKR